MRKWLTVATMVTVAVLANPRDAAACDTCSGDPNFPGMRFCGGGAFFNFDTCEHGDGSAFMGECDQCETHQASLPFRLLDTENDVAVALAVAAYGEIEYEAEDGVLILRNCIGRKIATRPVPEHVAVVLAFTLASD